LTWVRPVRLFSDFLDCCFPLFWLVIFCLSLQFWNGVYLFIGRWPFFPCLSNGDMSVYDFSL
jgi:hypothetical protein